MDESTQKFLADLAGKLGATSGELLKLYSQKIFIEGAADMAMALIGSALLVFALPQAWKRSANAGGFDRDFGRFILGLGALILGILTATAIYSSVLELFAPQGVALERIITHAK